MYKIKRAEKKKLRRAIKKKKRRMNRNRPSIMEEALQRKTKLLNSLNISSSASNNRPQPQKTFVGTNADSSSDQVKSPKTGNGVIANPNNNADYVEFEDLKPEYQELVERFIKTDREYMRQLQEEEKEDNELVGPEGAEKQPEEPKDDAKKQPKLSKKKLKQLKRIPVAQLKVLVNRPDLVESWDVTAKDPLLLMWLKSYKNTVVVPKHWSQKRKFLQNKRGRENWKFWW